MRSIALLGACLVVLIVTGCEKTIHEVKSPVGVSVAR